MIEGDLLGLNDVNTEADDRNLQAISEVGSGLKDHNIEDTEKLLEKKRAVQWSERDRLLDGEYSDHNSSNQHPSGGAASNSDSNNQDQPKKVFTRERRDLTGFAHRPSALSSGPKRKKSSTSLSRRNSSGGGTDGYGSEDDEDDDEEWVPDLFVFEYGTVVMWGMTEREEKRVLANL